MFPVEFDYRVLSTLPFPTTDRTSSVIHLLKSLVLRRVIPYFRSKRGTDPIKLALAADHFIIQRLEDENNLIGMVSLLTHSDHQWNVLIHERIFDYISFVIPRGLETRLSDGAPEEQKTLAFMELLLRHQFARRLPRIQRHDDQPLRHDGQIHRDPLDGIVRQQCAAIALLQPQTSQVRARRHHLIQQLPRRDGEHPLIAQFLENHAIGALLEARENLLKETHAPFMFVI